MTDGIRETAENENVKPGVSRAETWKKTANKFGDLSLDLSGKLDTLRVRLDTDGRAVFRIGPEYTAIDQKEALVLRDWLARNFGSGANP